MLQNATETFDKTHQKGESGKIFIKRTFLNLNNIIKNFKGNLNFFKKQTNSEWEISYFVLSKEIILKKV